MSAVERQQKLLDLYTEIVDTFESMIKDMEKNVEKGNKAAGVRARGLSIKLCKTLKEYRKESLLQLKESEED